MNKLQRLLLSSDHMSKTTLDGVLLVLRLAFGGALFTHGLDKWNHLAQMSESFPDPLGIGHAFSLYLAIFAEAICALGVCIGCLHRLALVPMIFTMGIAFFVIHNGSPFATRELAFLYLIAFIVLLFTGPGKYSVDQLILHRRSSKKQR